MMNTNDNQICNIPLNETVSCCKVESIINIDERGQMVLPKETREKANIRAGDKLAILTWEREGKICCISMVKAEEFTEMIRGMLGPMMEEIMR